MKFEQFNPKNIREQRTPETNKFFDKKYAELHPEEDVVKLEGFASQNNKQPTQETKDFFDEMYERQNPGKTLDEATSVDVSKEMEAIKDLNIKQKAREQYENLPDDQKEMFSFLKERYDKEDGLNEQESLENPSDKENSVNSFGSIEEIENFLEVNSDKLSEDDTDFLRQALKERYEQAKEQSSENQNSENQENTITSFKSIKEIEDYLEENSGNIPEEDVSFLNNAIEERLASTELPKEITKEENQLFVDKGEASTERLYAIAKKIKAGKVFEEIEIPMYNEHSERIEGFLKNMQS